MQKTTNLAKKSAELIKKNKISVLSSVAFATALCCVVACAGNKSSVESSPSVSESSVVSVVTESSEPTILETQQEGYGLYIDGSFVAAFSDKTIGVDAIETLLAERVSNFDIDASAKNSFVNSIEYISGTYPSEAFSDIESVSQMLSGNVTDYLGNILPVTLKVSSVMTYSESVVIEHDIKTIYTNGLKDGVEKIVTSGKDGKGTETYLVTYVDGVFYSQTTLSLDVTTPAVDEVVNVGTRADSMTTASLGTFVKPYDGYITSYVGPRWGRTHNGIDIVKYGGNCYGDPCFSAADGVVIRADWYNGYGKCVIVDHGDGIETLYAHLSDFSVEVGDVVSAGDEVGKIGSTGRSTGPHLHFEVHVDGEVVNPLIFVDYE